MMDVWLTAYLQIQAVTIDADGMYSWSMTSAEPNFMALLSLGKIFLQRREQAPLQAAHSGRQPYTLPTWPSGPKANHHMFCQSQKNSNQHDLLRESLEQMSESTIGSRQSDVHGVEVHSAVAIEYILLYRPALDISLLCVAQFTAVFSMWQCLKAPWQDILRWARSAITCLAA